MPWIDLLLPTLALVGLIVLTDSLGSWVAMAGWRSSGTVLYLAGFAASVTLAFEFLPMGWAFAVLVSAAFFSTYLARPFVAKMFAEARARRKAARAALRAAKAG